MTNTLPVINLQLYEEYLSCGLVLGEGNGGMGVVCIQQALQEIMTGKTNTDIKCVHPYIRNLVITLNDLNWTSEIQRAAGMHDVGLAQLGSAVSGELNFFQEELSTWIMRQVMRDIAAQALKAGYISGTTQRFIDNMDDQWFLMNNRHFEYDLANPEVQDTFEHIWKWFYIGDPLDMLFWFEVLHEELPELDWNPIFHKLTKLTVDTMREHNFPGCELLDQK